MSLTESNMMALGTLAPSFLLPDTMTGSNVSLQESRGSKATVLLFICNHCPYVIHVINELVNIANNYKNKGVEFIAISSNDAVKYPDDAPDKMNLVGRVLQFPFPYLYDETQDVAKAYEAACTPDIYVFDNELKLAYRGRVDGSRPGNDQAINGSDLRFALEAVLLGQKDIRPQIPSAGCNIKWK